MTPMPVNPARILALCAVTLTCGCVTSGPRPNETQPPALRDRAIQAVKLSVRYRGAPVVRAMGIEVMQRHLAHEGLPWIRNALQDEDDGVRFAAALALGFLNDKPSRSDLRKIANSKNDTLRVAACFALQRMGDNSRSALLPEFLLDNPSPDVRADAALVLGLLDEPGAVKVLARAMQDLDERVQHKALESMALLRSPEAIQQLTFSASSGAGPLRVPAIMILGDIRDPALENTFKYKFAKGEYIETRLAAARGLALLGDSVGYDLAAKSMSFNSPQRDILQDPPAEQIWRVRQLAAIVLGAIGDKRALPLLERQLNDQSDPRLQLVAADAILEILGTGPLGRSRQTDHDETRREN
jgi:HEAT repeat protein